MCCHGLIELALDSFIGEEAEQSNIFIFSSRSQIQMEGVIQSVTADFSCRKKPDDCDEDSLKNVTFRVYRNSKVTYNNNFICSVRQSWRIQTESVSANQQGAETQR